MALERAYLAGVDMNMGDYDGRTALHLACVENHPACVKYLIETCKVYFSINIYSSLESSVWKLANSTGRLNWTLRTDGGTLLFKMLYDATIQGNKNLPK